MTDGRPYTRNPYPQLDPPAFDRVRRSLASPSFPTYGLDHARARCALHVPAGRTEGPERKGSRRRTRGNRNKGVSLPPGYRFLPPGSQATLRNCACTSYYLVGGLMAKEIRQGFASMGPNGSWVYPPRPASSMDLLDGTCPARSGPAQLQ